MLQTAYLILTGAGVAGDIAADLVAGLTVRFDRVLIVPTPNASRVLNRRDLSRLPSGEVVESYFAPSILPRPPLGLVLVAPCTFNSLNHLAAGLAPNLALAIVNEAIGRRTPVVIAVACNEPLWAHPAAPASAAMLRAWGCAVIEPQANTNGTRMSPLASIFAAVDDTHARYRAAAERDDR